MSPESAPTEDLNPSPDQTSRPSDQSVVDFTFEMGMLRQESRHGWLRLHQDEESLAEHTARAAQLGYLVAAMEGFEHPELVATMILFHDRHEVRTGDADMVNKQYVVMDEERAASDQVSSLGMLGETMQQMWLEVENRSSVAGNIAKDAELLECCFVARELVVRGITDAQSWIDSTRPVLQTESAKRLLEVMNTADPAKWWKEVCEGK